MAGEGDRKELLRELRIERAARDEPESGGGRPRLILIALALCLAMAGVWLWWALRARPIGVEAARAVAGSRSGGAAAVLQATGYVTARREATVSAQITGTLTEVRIEEGERVRAGDVLARLDDTAQRAALAQARAQLAVAAALEQQYQAQLEQARRDRERSRELLRSDAVSHQSAEEAQTQVEALAAQVQAQQREEQLARAGIQAAQVQLDYTVIRAPFSGVIVARAAQAGEIISPISAGGGFTRTGIGTIVDMDSLEIEVDVNEAYIHRVQPGQVAQAVLDAYPDWSVPAHVIAIIPTADRSKATVKVRIGIDPKDPRILPDMGVRVSFLEPAPAAAQAAAAPLPGVLVPSEAILGRAAGSVVFVIAGGHVREQTVRPGATEGELRRVEGLAPGSEVVLHPPPGLRDGAAVTVREAH